MLSVTFNRYMLMHVFSENKGSLIKKLPSPNHNPKSRKCYLKARHGKISLVPFLRSFSLDLSEKHLKFHSRKETPKGLASRALDGRRMCCNDATFQTSAIHDVN